MQRITLVRYTTQPDRADENEGLSRAVFEELRRTRPEGVAYAVFRDGSDFTHLFVNLADDSSHTVTELPSFKAFSKDIETRTDGPVRPERLVLTLMDSYGLAG